MRWLLLLLLAMGCAATQPAPSEPKTAEACTSDLACRAGWELCAKPYGAMTGRCVATVDRDGLPIYTPPRPASAWIGAPGCTFGRRCPAGSMCVQGTCER